MADGVSSTLTQKAGPLPIWTWTIVGIGGVAGFMYYRNKKAAATAATQQTGSTSQSNLGNVPISNLSTSAQPMPIQMGDTFVNVSQPPDNDSPGPNPHPITPQPVPNPPVFNPSPITPPKIKAPPPPNKPTPAPTKPASPPPPGGKTTTVTVCPWPAWCGSLWGIAQHEWGDGNLWPNIYKANQAKIGSNPNLIHTGTVLTIPAKS